MVWLKPCLPVHEWCCCQSLAVWVVFPQTVAGAETDLDRALVFVVPTDLLLLPPRNPPGWGGDVDTVMGLLVMVMMDLLLVWASGPLSGIAVVFWTAACWQACSCFVSWPVVLRVPADREVAAVVVSLAVQLPWPASQLQVDRSATHILCADVLLG